MRYTDGGWTVSKNLTTSLLTSIEHPLYTILSASMRKVRNTLLFVYFTIAICNQEPWRDLYTLDPMTMT